MFKRDQITFDRQDDSDDDVNANQGEEVLGLNLPSQEGDSGNENGEEKHPEQEFKSKKRKTKIKPDISTKGRFGKPIPNSDDEVSVGSSLEDEDERDWGRQYYSRPSNRREKEKDEYDETREEDRELEEKEVRRLQKKARQSMSGAEVWGFTDTDLLEPTWVFAFCDRFPSS